MSEKKEHSLKETFGTLINSALFLTILTFAITTKEDIASLTIAVSERVGDIAEIVEAQKKHEERLQNIELEHGSRITILENRVDTIDKKIEKQESREK